MLIGFTDEYKEKRNRKILKLLELESIKHLKAKNLSSGQKQRVAIARALTSFPKLLLLDEPFSNLDKILKDKLFDFIIHEAQKKHCGVILITHQAEEALKYADRIALVISGKIAQIGSKEQVYYKPKNLKIAKTLGDYNVIEAADFEKTSPYFKTKKRALLRPNQFSDCSKKEADINVKVINCFFNGKCYELLVQTRSGNEIVIYSHYPKLKEEQLFCKIDKSN
jgi:ABC-type Fe3+/spermidine/putrescine transport system ATPase subunit